ncbi:GMC family oxidoreductase N-terminal domain-containing protein, partial [Escherichia coli]|uniref:GMC family oxidoreductase N-terminal domain-containing protein n=1 Tax=Escherichia coli TaxID=562 RepID=UPI00200D36DA
MIAVTGNPMGRGLAELGWDAAAIPRSVAGCGLGSVTGSCVTGCPLGARQPAATTWLHDAVEYGSRIVLGANVDEVLIRHGKAVG